MRKPMTLLLIGIVGLVLTFGAIWVFERAIGSKPYAVARAPVLGSVPKRSREEILAACDIYVHEAESEARAAIERRASAYGSFIEDRKAKVPQFADEVVSWYGKWRAIKTFLPFTDEDGHRQYVEEQFSTYVLSNAEFGQATELAVAGSLKDLQGIENRLAVKLRAEITGSPVASNESLVAAEDFAAAINRIKAASQWDAAKAGGSLVVSEVAAIVGVQVLTRLGVSAGILATSASNSMWTFGGSVVLGLIADLLWGWIDDPAGDIERETVVALDQLAADGSEAIRGELGNAVTLRSQLWSKAVQEMVP